MPEGQDTSGFTPLEARYTQTLKEERQAYQVARRQGRLFDFFNNFQMLLPNEAHQWGFMGSMFNEPNDEAEFWNTPFGEHFGGIDRENHSDRYLSETPHQFYTHLDKLRQGLGLTNETIIELRRKMNQEEEFAAAFYDAIAPLYFRLRELGYKPRDLIQ